MMDRNELEVRLREFTEGFAAFLRGSLQMMRLDEDDEMREILASRLSTEISTFAKGIEGLPGVMVIQCVLKAIDEVGISQQNIEEIAKLIRLESTKDYLQLLPDFSRADDEDEDLSASGVCFNEDSMAPEEAALHIEDEPQDEPQE